ncbi:MAG TPA: hypothetical protein PLF54_10660 [Deltaproteobacteria bacterium]|nr:hypothetical protein [Deltaproteobacteria bacterium]HQJ09452.1 hypothetical protein [Deltaproteobacteria bacterium]
MESETRTDSQLETGQNYHMCKDMSPNEHVPCPLNQYDLRSCMRRFFSVAIVGIFIDLMIFFIYVMAIVAGCRPGTIGLYYSLIEVPIICGILGVFFFNELQDLTHEVVQRVSQLRR